MFFYIYASQWGQTTVGLEASVDGTVGRGTDARQSVGQTEVILTGR